MERIALLKKPVPQETTFLRLLVAIQMAAVVAIGIEER